MVELIVGGKGKGKTKILLEKAAEAIKNANGSVVYVDKNNQHMYELSNKIRLVDITKYPVKGTEGFFGFISGMIASNHDLEYVKTVDATCEKDGYTEYKCLTCKQTIYDDYEDYGFGRWHQCSYAREKINI